MSSSCAIISGPTNMPMTNVVTVAVTAIFRRHLYNCDARQNKRRIDWLFFDFLLTINLLFCSVLQLKILCIVERISEEKIEELSYEFIISRLYSKIES